MLDRGTLTDQILFHLTDGTGLLVGDHTAPKDGGWSSGTPNTGTFVAYSVLMAGSVMITPNSFDKSKFDARANYTVRTYGMGRKQTDDIASQVRARFETSPKSSISGHIPRLFWCSQIGAVERISSNDPASWRITDAFTVECYA